MQCILGFEGCFPGEESYKATTWKERFKLQQKRQLMSIYKIAFKKVISKDMQNTTQKQNTNTFEKEIVLCSGNIAKFSIPS